MRGPINKLSDTKIESALKTARKAIAASEAKSILLGDGGGLTLQISKTGAASWLHRYMRLGKPVGLGLGGYPEVSLRLARTKAEECRRILAEDRDPLTEKRAAVAAAKVEKTKHKTFDECATDYISDHKAEWKNPKHLQQWENTLATYASPVIGQRPIGKIATPDIKRILSPIWTTKNETASRLRARIESVIDWATAHELRTGDNPARWKGHLEHLLARTTPEQRADKHHAALPHAQIPAFMQSLTCQEGMSRWSLEFLILTACRTSEVTGARWAEIDEAGKLWTIPKERMKAGREHRVPLVDRTLDILKEVKPFSSGKFVFPGGTSDKPLSNMAMNMLLRRMEITDCTVHGFRSTFRDWVGEKTNHDFRTAEAALAHGLPDKVAAAYARSDLFEKRFSMMRDWANHCASREISDSQPATQKMPPAKGTKHG